MCAASSCAGWQSYAKRLGACTFARNRAANRKSECGASCALSSAAKEIFPRRRRVHDTRGKKNTAEQGRGAIKIVATRGEQKRHREWEDRYIAGLGQHVRFCVWKLAAGMANLQSSGSRATIPQPTVRANRPLPRCCLRTETFATLRACQNPQLHFQLPTSKKAERSAPLIPDGPSVSLMH